MAKHELKISENNARAHLSGVKPWELRNNDRDFKIGDKINFNAIDEQGFVIMRYTREIKFVQKGGQCGLDDEFVIITIE